MSCGFKIREFKNDNGCNAVEIESPFEGGFGDGKKCAVFTGDKEESPEDVMTFAVSWLHDLVERTNDKYVAAMGGVSPDSLPHLQASKVGDQ